MSRPTSPVSPGLEAGPLTSGRVSSVPIVPVAIAIVVAFSAVALFDVVAGGLTGRNPLSRPEQQAPATGMAVAVIHTLVYLAIVVVLVTAARPVFTGRRWRSALRWLLVASYGAMGVGILAAQLAGVEPAGVGQTVVDGAFAVMLLAPGALGITLLVAGERTAAAWLLTAAVPTLVLGFILDAAASDWAHPAYSEVCANLGLVLLGTRAAVGAAQKRPARTLEKGR